MNKVEIEHTFREIAQEADVEWIKRKRQINTEILITEIARGKINRLGLRQIAAQSIQQISASALVQAKQRIPVHVLSTVLKKLSDSVSVNRRILAVDSSKVSLPLRFLDYGVNPRNDAARKPLIMCSTLFDMRSDVPVDVIIADHHNERSCLIHEHIDNLHNGDLIVGDRGYFSAEVCRELKRNNVDVLFRVKERACRPITAFVASRRRERVVNIDGVSIKCFKYTFNTQRYVVVTTDTSMSLACARTLYKARWRIEEGFRRWKSDFNLCKHMAHSLHTFKVDVLIIAIAHTLVRGAINQNIITFKNPATIDRDLPHTMRVCVRAFRACALALFDLNSRHHWRETGIWILTRRSQF